MIVLIRVFLLICLLASVVIMIIKARKDERVKKFVIIVPILYLVLAILHSTCFFNLVSHCRHCTIYTPYNPSWYYWFDANELKNILLIPLVIFSCVKLIFLRSETIEDKGLTMATATVFVVSATIHLFLNNFY